MIEAMERVAGPEMDAEIARRVFGIDAWVGNDSFGPYQDAQTHQSETFPTGWLPRFSDSIAAAWLVVEKMRERFGTVSVENFNETWHCYIADTHTYGGELREVFGAGEADTPALAICRAALEALGYHDAP